EVLELDDSPEAVLAEFCKREWCDGLPIVPPTEARVRTMLGGRDPEKSLGAMPPLWRQATLGKLAINAVMAGCEPAYFAIIGAATWRRRAAPRNFRTASRKMRMRRRGRRCAMAIPSPSMAASHLTTSMITSRRRRRGS